MFPSDHFVRFYNEVFKFLLAKGEDHLNRYYRRVSANQEYHCLELFKQKGLQGMYEYWEHIRIEENCDLTHSVSDDCYSFSFKKCPSLEKVIDNDSSPCMKYCDHCPGWILPLMTKCGFFVVYNLIDRMKPMCAMYVYSDRQKAEKKKAALLNSFGKDVVADNFSEKS